MKARGWLLICKLLICGAMFIGGFILALKIDYMLFPCEPEIEEVEKEVKIYDFTQEPDVVEPYANLHGLTMINKKTLEEIVAKETRYEEIFMEGFNEGQKHKCGMKIKKVN